MKREGSRSSAIGGMLDSPSLSSSLLVDSNNGLVLSCEDYFISSSSSSSNSIVYNDNYDRNNNNNSNNYRQSDANVECLFDIYFIPQSNESTIGGVDEIKVQDTLSYTINKHLGHCDFSISTIVSSLSTRLLLQILMLVLVDKPIILLSSSCTLLTKVQHLIPRLIWPFRINTTHVMKQILSQSDLARFVIGNSCDNNDIKKNKNKNVNNPYYLSSKHHKKTPNVGKKANWREMINEFASNVGSYLSTPKWGSVKYSKNANRSLSEITILKKSKRKLYHTSNRSNSDGGNSSNSSSHLDRKVIHDDDYDDMISNKFNNFYQLNDVSIDNNESKQSPSDVDDNNKNDDDGDDDKYKRDGKNRNRVVCFSPDVTIDTEINDDYDSQSDDDYTDDDDDDYIDEDSDDEDGNADKFINDANLSHHKRSNGTTSSSNDKDDKSCVVGIESTVFYGASNELRLDLEEMRIKGVAFTIIDIDSGTLWVYYIIFLSCTTSITTTSTT
jgi:hypothetical protein